MGVAAGADGVRNEETVQPGVDDAVARLQGHAAALDDELRQGLVHLDVGRFRVSCGVAERLHEHRRQELEAGEFFQLVSGHGTGGVLGTDGGHLRLASGTREDAGDAAGLAYHLLRKRVTLACLRHRVDREGEDIGRREAESLAGAVGKGAADDQRDAAAGAELVGKGVRRDGEGGEDFAALAPDLALLGVDHDDVAGLHLGDVGLDRERAGVLRGVEEDRSDDAADDDAVTALVRYAGDVLADVPQDAVAGGLAGRAGTHDVAHESDLEPFSPELGDGGVAVREAGLAHGKGVQGDVRAAPGVACRGEVVGVDLAVDLVDLHLHGLRKALFGGEPLRVGPGLDDFLCGCVGLGKRQHLVECVVHQGGAAKRLDGLVGKLGVLERCDQRGYVVAAQHGAEDLDRLFLGDERGFLRTGDDTGEETGLHFGCGVDARGNPLLEELKQERLLAGRRCLKQFAKFRGLLGVERLRGDTECFSFCLLLQIRFNHGPSSDFVQLFTAVMETLS